MGNETQKQQSQTYTQQQNQPQKQQQTIKNEKQSTNFDKVFNQYQINNNVSIDALPINHLKLKQYLNEFTNKLFNTNQLSSSQFNDLCQILVKAPDYNSQILVKLRPLELMFRIFGYQENDNILNDECFQLLSIIFYMVNTSETSIYFMNRIYDDTLDKEQRIGYVCNKLNSISPLINDYIQQFWGKLLFGSLSYQITTPKLDIQRSKIIDQNILTLFSTQSQLCKEFTLLYNNQNSGTSFNRLAWNILGYGGPTLILITLNKKHKGYNDNQYPIIFGAYNPNIWTDGLKFQSDSGCFLMSISPSFRIYSTINQDSNYAYLNTKNIDRSKYKVGLGFGGNSEHTAFRLWIDDEIENKSRVSSQDETYQPGYIAGEIEGQINIVYLEVFGLGGKEALIAQDKYRQERMEELERMRKVDKKQFFSGFDQAMFLEKTFAHRDQVREEIEK